jgi:hypothetical protein
MMLRSVTLSRFRGAGLLLALGCAFSFLVACGSGETGTSESDWTVREGKLELERDLRVSETDSFYFGSIIDVAVDSDGNAYALDGDAGHIKVIGPKGGLRDSLGRTGQGPGEFQQPREIVVARGDSLYVLDPRSSRISVFGPSGRFARGVQLEYQGFAEHLMVPDSHSGFLLPYTSRPPPDAAGKGSTFICRVTPSGTVADTVLTATPREVKPIQKEEFSVFFSIPFGEQPYVALGPKDQIHFGRNDSLRVSSYSLAGSLTAHSTLSFDPVPVTAEERKERLERFPDEDRASIRDALPDTKPAFNHFLVDDAGRYWVGRPTADPDSTAWWVATPEKKRVVTDTLPSEARILAIRDGRAYGRATTEMGAPALVRYEINVER